MSGVYISHCACAPTKSILCFNAYVLVVVLKGDFGVSSSESVVGSVIPGNVINPVGFVVVPSNKKNTI